MKPIKFREMTVTWATVTWAENQPEYRPLPAFTDERETISCWRLSWRERLQALLGGRLWLRQCNFSKPLQPQLPTFQYPFQLRARTGNPIKQIVCVGRFSVTYCMDRRLSCWRIFRPGRGTFVTLGRITASWV